MFNLALLLIINFFIDRLIFLSNRSLRCYERLLLVKVEAFFRGRPVRSPPPAEGSSPLSNVRYDRIRVLPPKLRKSCLPAYHTPGERKSNWFDTKKDYISNDRSHFFHVYL